MYKQNQRSDEEWNEKHELWMKKNAQALLKIPDYRYDETQLHDVELRKQDTMTVVSTRSLRVYESMIAWVKKNTGAVEKVFAGIIVDQKTFETRKAWYWALTIPKDDVEKFLNFKF